MSLHRRIGIALIAGTLLFPAFAIAQSGDGDQPADQEAASQTQAEDPPARVGRLSFMEGQVSQFGEGSTDWVEAQLNFPVTSNTAFATGGDGRAEFELGAATARIDFGTELDVVKLDEADTDLRLPQGGVAIDLPNPPADAEPISTVLTTPRGDVTLSAPGHYFIAAGTADEPTTVTVLDGSAQITDAANATFNVAAGQSGALTGDGNTPTFAIQTVPMGAFATWVKQRDTIYTQAAPLPSQVSPRMTGVVQLGAYGAWQTEPQYGAIWMPRSLPANWQPYREGHWAYIRPWGWTWVDSEPWGFAPFHYGRWIRFHDRWAWAPGTVPQPGVTLVARPVYAPALVVFASVGGVNVSVGAGAPAVAWYPLGWNEPYIPSYRVSRGYIERVNIRVVEQPRLVEVANIYNRIYVRGGHFDPYQQLHVGIYRDHAVAVPRAAFVGAKPIAQVAVRPNVQALRPAIRPAAVKPPPARPQPKLATTEPPKPKILPAAKRAPIPQKLMAPKARPAAARPEARPETKPGTTPATARPGARPEAKPGTTPATARPGARPEPKPGTTPTTARPEARAEAKPGAKPATARPEARPEANPGTKPATVRPEARPEVKPGTKPATVRPEARPEVKPGTARPEARPGAKPGTKPATVRPEEHREAKPQTKPTTMRPEATPKAEPKRHGEPRHAKPAAQPEKPEGKPEPTKKKPEEKPER
jgi:hypothetical protein